MAKEESKGIVPQSNSDVAEGSRSKKSIENVLVSPTCVECNVQTPVFRLDNTFIYGVEPMTSIEDRIGAVDMEHPADGKPGDSMLDDGLGRTWQPPSWSEDINDEDIERGSPAISSAILERTDRKTVGGLELSRQPPSETRNNDGVSRDVGTCISEC